MPEEEDLPQVVEPDADTPVTNMVIVTLEGEDKHYLMEALNLTIDNTEAEIMAAVKPAVLRDFDVDITDLYKTRKALNSDNIYIIPNSTAGK